MDEATWLACADPAVMLNFLHGHSPRKFRLFACASCRQIWHLIKDPICRQAVEAAELTADGLMSVEEMTMLHETAQNSKPLFADASWAAAWTAAPDVLQAAEESSAHAASWVGRLAAEKANALAWAAVRSGATEEQKTAAWGNYDNARNAAAEEHRHLQAALLRDIFGNPWQPLEPGQWPATIVELAQALYDGADCAFALADALEEAGQSELAEHFRVSGWHPKGCWVVDLVLGKS